MHFTTNPGLHNRPQLKLGDHVLPYVDSIKYLGLIWDSKLTWRPHIAKLKADCTKLLGIMRFITNYEWGADQKSCMMIYRALIRSKMDYGCQVYGSAAPTTLNALSSITTEAIRIATGAFKSTPSDSLLVLANEMPLDLRWEYLNLKYYYKMKSILDNPAHEHVVPLVLRTLFINKGIPLHFSHRVQNILEKYNLRKSYVKPKSSLSYQPSPPQLGHSNNQQNLKYHVLSSARTICTFFYGCIANSTSNVYTLYDTWKLYRY